MTNTEWVEHVRACSKEYTDFNYCVIALNGEAGEVAEWYKKAVLRGNPDRLTDQQLMHELGDVLFYLTRIASLKDWTLEQVMLANKLKLDARQRLGKEVG